MSFAQPRRRSRLAAAAGAGLLTAAGLVAITAITATPAQAAVSGTVTVTTPANKKVAADTAKQVVVLTVSGVGATVLTEDNVVGVKLGSDTDCDDLDNYVVTSPTTVTVKTPAGGCAAGTEEVAILFTGAESLTKAAGIQFVAPPAIDDVGDKPVINDNSALLAVGDQTRRFSTAGGQTVRVKAATGYNFEFGVPAGLAASLGGKAGTEIKIYSTDTSTVPITTGTGSSMSFKTAAGMTDNTLIVTQNGVSKSFVDAAHLAVVGAVPLVTSLTVNSGRAGSTPSTVINGKFATSLTDLQNSSKWLFKFCNLPATVTAVNAGGTAVTVTVPDITDDSDGLGTTTYAGSCPVTATDVTLNLTSPRAPGAVYTSLVE